MATMLICTYTLPAYISDIYVDSLCIISVKKLHYEKSWFCPSLLIYCKLTHGGVTSVGRHVKTFPFLFKLTDESQAW